MVCLCRRKIWPRSRFESDTGCEETSVWSTCELLKKGQSVSDMEKATFLFPHTLEDTATTTSSSTPASRRDVGLALASAATASWPCRAGWFHLGAPAPACPTRGECARGRTSYRNTASGRTPAARRAGHVRQADGAEDAACPVGHIADDAGQPRRRCTASGCSRRGRRTNPGRAAALWRAKAASPRRPREDGARNTARGWTVFQIPSTPGNHQPLDSSRVAQIERRLGRPRPCPAGPGGQPAGQEPDGCPASAMAEGRPEALQVRLMDADPPAEASVSVHALEADDDDDGAAPPRWVERGARPRHHRARLCLCLGWESSFAVDAGEFAGAEVAGGCAYFVAGIRGGRRREARRSSMA